MLTLANGSKKKVILRGVAKPRFRLHPEVIEVHERETEDYECYLENNSGQMFDETVRLAFEKTQSGGILITERSANRLTFMLNKKLVAEATENDGGLLQGILYSGEIEHKLSIKVLDAKRAVILPRIVTAEGEGLREFSIYLRSSSAKITEDDARNTTIQKLAPISSSVQGGTLELVSYRAVSPLLTKLTYKLEASFKNLLASRSVLSLSLNDKIDGKLILLIPQSNDQ